MTSKIGPKEAQRRAMREQGLKRATPATRAALHRAVKPTAAAAPTFCTYPRCKCIVSTSAGQPDPDCPRGLPAQPPRTEAPPAPQRKKGSVKKPKKAKRAA
jgi:hypothetical protein